MPLHATTVNINWTLDGDTYAQTSCETGGNFTLPTTPTKYGYHFVGWQQDGSMGAWVQSGTPTPDNPIEPTFRQFGNTVLRAVGSGNNLIADSYDVSTGKITRRIGVKVLDGTEDWEIYTGWSANSFSLRDFLPSRSGGLCTHYVYNGTWGAAVNNTMYINSTWLIITDTRFSTTTAWKQYLADQYANGAPVIIYYPLATPVEEVYNAQ